MRVSKQLRSVPAGGVVFSTSGTRIDWDNGNIVITTASCQPMTFVNMKEGGSYTLIVRGGGSATCTFSQTVPDNLDASSFKFMPPNFATVANKTTVYTFIRAGDIVYVSWITGF
jgi:hypothetical protein